MSKTHASGRGNSGHPIRQPASVERADWSTWTILSNRQLISSKGSLSGTAMPSSGRTDVTTLSPLSNLRAKSNFGGYRASEAKYASYDHTVIQGRAEKPSYLWITDESVEIRASPACQ